ncbi:hypothetical protein SteCoe_15898 [Stentor coeruleus]|uniref:Uncharacterized protein n=1 Tax=Stentor coeruleus TaxID=5963 RepID=A0A1R2C2H9_9CILI|nr:hypothetical protein SteCoe_15898 [Stentor coeruleus]
MEPSRQVDLVHTYKETDSSIYSIRWNFDDLLLATASVNGYVSIYETFSNQNPTQNINQNSYQLKQSLDCKVKQRLPLCNIRWRPEKGLNKGILMVASSEGAVLHWQASTGRLLNTIFFPENQALCCDYSPDGENFAIGWKDMAVKIYDDNTKQLVKELRRSGENSGHGNRILSVKWQSSNIVFSAGWDNNVYMWDLRSRAPVKFFQGAFLTGDAMDVFEDTIATVDCSLSDQLKIWSVSQGRLIHSVLLEQGGRPLKGYTLQFSKNNDAAMIFVGGSGNLQGYFLNSRLYTILNTISQIQAPIYTCDFGNQSSKIALGTGDGTIYEFHIGGGFGSI